MKTIDNKFVKGGIAGLAMLGLGACTSMTSQKAVDLNADLAKQLQSSKAYYLEKGVVFDKNDGINYTGGNPVSVDVYPLIGKPTIEHSSGDDNKVLGHSVLVKEKDVAPDETYRISCPIEKDDEKLKTKASDIVKSWGPCIEYIEKPNQGGSDGGQGGDSGGSSGDSGGGGSGGGGGGAGGSGGGICLVHGSIVLIDSGLERIENLNLGDEVISLDVEANKLVKTKITKIIKNHPRGFYYIINGNLKITNDHPVLVLRNGFLNWVRIENLEIGDMTKSVKGFMKVESKEKIDKNALTVYMETELGSFIAKAGESFYIVKANYAPVKKQLQESIMVSA
ncbi:hypothetical protein COU59_00835 [Candidatus Pacearchaeota archaeon CG10_big_fil_rev_8_21_14_0_10_34_12]|nr:MAG: hypothetical protein COU59_00835 [Candidatus Pacearchaeota archaeon CG10_big_fil_rev_8_21_14_0_10_34_12]